MGTTSCFGKNTLALWLILSSLAFGGVKYPPLLPTAGEQQQYILQMMQEYPWLAPTGISAHLPQYVALEQTWIGTLYNLPQFQQLNAARPDLLTIKVQTFSKEQKQVKVLPSQKIELFRREVEKTIHSLWPSSDADPLQAAIEDRLVRLTKSDPQKILVGLISLLPQAARASYFKASFEGQLELLARDPDLNDQVIADNFQSEIHNLGDLPLTKQAVLDRVRELVDEETELISLLRAKFALSIIARETDLIEKLDDDDVNAAIQLVRKADADAFDVASENETDSADRLFKSLQNGWRNASRDERGLAAKYIERVFKAMKNEQRAVELREVRVAHDLFTIQEIIPELGVYRGLLGGDCSTTHSFAFPFSPLERVFLIFDKKGDPMRLYFSGTLLQVNRKPTFYLHDIAGPALTKETQGIVLHALYEAREHLGVQLITLPTRTVREANAGEEPSKSPHITALIQDLDTYIGEAVNHHYLDVDVRKFLGALQASAYDYDSPEFNVQGHIFVPRHGAMEGIQAVVVGAERNIPPVEEEPLGPKETFLRLLDLLAGEEKPEMYFDGLGIDRNETQRILSVVNNANRQNLAQYYNAMKAEFGRYGIEFSEKYLRKHSRYFLFGHLQASDACTTQDAALREKTIQFTIETIRRGRVRDFAYDLVAANPDFFNHSDEFREYVGGIPVRGEDNLLRLDKLLARGIDPTLVTWNDDRITAVTGGLYESLQLAALRFLAKNSGAHITPVYLALLAKALQNEKHKSDETSLFAATQLVKIRTDDAHVNKSLLATVKHDENVQIAYLAAIALIQNGQPHKKAHARLSENQNNKAIPRDILELGNRLLQALGPLDCGTEIANQDPKKK